MAVVRNHGRHMLYTPVSQASGAANQLQDQLVCQSCIPFCIVRVVGVQQRVFAEILNNMEVFRADELRRQLAACVYREKKPAA